MQETQHTEISRDALRQLVEQIHTKGRKQRDANPRTKWTYRRGVGAGMAQAAQRISIHFDLEENDNGD
jgi:hypothetical protein